MGANLFYTIILRKDRSMRIYRIKEDYINSLRKSDDKVLKNKSEKRPYLGVVFSVNGYDYFVPLSSPKKKHLTMKNTKDFHKINGGIYGVINFNDMIPVKSTELIYYDIAKEPELEYKKLLEKQQEELSKIEKTIRKKAEKLYELYSTADDKLTPFDLSVKARCCNFPLLEQKCNTYNVSIK